MKPMADNYTKPSRLKHRCKRRWKISNSIENGLTNPVAIAILFTSINKSTGIRTPFSIGVQTPFHGVFLRPKKIITPLVRAFVMVARSGQAKAWPAPIPGSSNPLRVAAQSFEPLAGGYQSSVLESPL